MIRFSVCVETTFHDLPPRDRIARAAACGAAAVEFCGWRDEDPDAIARAKRGGRSRAGRTGHRRRRLPGIVPKPIDSLDAPGYVGLEFHPSGDPAKAVKDTIHLAPDQGGKRSWT